MIEDKQTSVHAQNEVFQFLKSPSAWPQSAFAGIEVIETHGALIFMAGEEVLKLKRAVKLPYFDFSTLENRRKFITRELEINAANAPDIYLGVVAITREADGSLAVAGKGVPVDWAVHMRRFGQDQLLSRVVDKEGISKDLALALADAIVASHTKARRAVAPAGAIEPVVEQVLAALAACPHTNVADAAGKFSLAIRAALGLSRDVRTRRARDGHVRRCHGDLHLGNLVMWRGAPVLFDAIEFDEQLATIDTLYDLAFLLMDLERHGARLASNTVLNRYLWRTGDPMDLEGLAALPVFMGLRAGIRAMVTLDRTHLEAGHGTELVARSVATLRLGIALATPAPPRLIVIGGLSGTGKTTLAAMLSPHLGSAPGALHLRTDLERKWLAGVSEFEHLPEAAYTLESAIAVTGRIMNRARLALNAGHSVILDGVFARPEERRDVRQLADETGATFGGLWLEADPAVMRARVSQRVHDASDATVAVVDKQLALATQEPGWPRINSAVEKDELYGKAIDALELKGFPAKPAIR